MSSRMSPQPGERIDRDRPLVRAGSEDDLARALELRGRRKGDKDVYRVHRRLGEPCPHVADGSCDGTIHQVDSDEHTVLYCPSCQTGGRTLKDRRLSRLLR